MPLASRVADDIDKSEYFRARFIVVIAPTAEWRKTCWRGRVPAELCKCATQTLTRSRADGREKERSVKRAAGEEEQHGALAFRLS